MSKMTDPVRQNLYTREHVATLQARIAELEADNILLRQALADVSVSDDVLADAKEKIELYALRGKVAQLEADVINAAELLTQLSATQMRLYEAEASLAAVPHWTRITDDQGTWPPASKNRIRLSESYDGEWWERSFTAALVRQLLHSDPSHYSIRPTAWRFQDTPEEP